MRSGKGLIKRGLALALALCMVITSLIVSPKTEAEAAAADSDGYRRVDYRYDSSLGVGIAPIKVGEYYIKSMENYISGDIYIRGLYISKKKDSGYKRIPKADTDCYGNSKQMYFCCENVLYKYVYKTGKTTVVKKFKKNSEPIVWNVYKNKIYLIGSDGKSYVYNLKTKKMSVLKLRALRKFGNIGGNFDSEGYGKYLYSCVYSSKKSAKVLYKITNKGIKKVKTLAMEPYPSDDGKYIYYASYQSGNSKRLVYYRAEIDGSGTKKLGTSSVGEHFLYTTVDAFTDKYVAYSYYDEDSDKVAYCVYTFATKKTKKIWMDSWGEFVGSYLYYCKYTSAKENEIAFYRCKLDGSGRKKLGSRKFSKSAWVYKVTDKYAICGTNLGHYKYTYASKKTTALWRGDDGQMDISGKYIYSWNLNEDNTTIYKWRIDGSSKKKLGKVNQSFGIEDVEYVSDKFIIYRTDTGRYVKYYFATKKSVYVKDPDYYY